VPINDLKVDENGSITFVGRIIDALLRFGDVKRCAYVEKYMAFYN